MSGHVVVATGFNREVACIRGLAGVVPVAGGGDPVGLRVRLEHAAAGAVGIVSFGMTGALVDGLAIGDWVVADRLWGAIDLACDPAWTAALAAALPGARIGGFYADGRMIDTVAEKLALGERHGALAVDMESHIAGAVAAEHGAALRDRSLCIGWCASPAAACDHGIDAARWRRGREGDAAIAGGTPGTGRGYRPDCGGLCKGDARTEAGRGSDRRGHGTAAMMGGRTAGRRGRKRVDA